MRRRVRGSPLWRNHEEPTPHDLLDPFVFLGCDRTSDPAVVAADPDFRDLLPYVKLGQIPSRVAAHTITDIAVGYQRSRGQERQWDVQVQMNNAFGVTALHNFQSAFVGTRVVAPRSAGVRVRFYW